MYSASRLANRVNGYLDALCCAHPDRHVGGAGNLDATRLFARVASSFGFEVRTQEFACVDWRYGAASIEVGGVRERLFPGPYSPPGDLRARLAAASSVTELESGVENGDFAGCVLLLHSEIVGEQLTPKNYPFYRWEAHTRIIEALEAARPGALIAATGRTSELVGSLYPFPLIEDADIDIPSAYLKDVDGEELLAHVGEEARIRIESERLSSKAEQVVARRGGRGQRIVVTAHIDSRQGSPGALDNATGVAVLMLLAEMLSAESRGPATEELPAIELVPFNGEDNYASPGQVAYLDANKDLSDVLLNVNIDGAGWRGHDAEVSFYECPDFIKGPALSRLKESPRLLEADPWPQGDHMIFVMRGVPAIAVTTADASRLRWEIAHTEGDIPAEVDAETVVAVAEYICDLVRQIPRSRRS